MPVTRVGQEIFVNTATGDSLAPQITTLSNGGFVVTWEDFSEGVGGAGGDTDGFAVKAQVFAADGTPVGLRSGSIRRPPAIKMNRRSRRCRMAASR